MNIFWFRRDLRLENNIGLFHSLSDGETLPIFIFDKKILNGLPKNDRRVNFIHDTISHIKKELNKIGSDILVFFDTPENVFLSLSSQFDVKKVYINHDYEPSAIERDESIKELLSTLDVELLSFKDQAIFEKKEVVTAVGNPYTVFTPYKNAWIKQLTPLDFKFYDCSTMNKNFLKLKVSSIPTLQEMGFIENRINTPVVQHDYFSVLKEFKNFIAKKGENYEKNRNYPNVDGTSLFSLYNRFGTVSIRDLVTEVMNKINDMGIPDIQKNGYRTFLNECIWRDFYFQILFNFQEIVDLPFKKDYRETVWPNDINFINAWKSGRTGYPIVDAGMRQLNETGYMHNRVRMIVASFLTKHLLCDYRIGEAYFAENLNDFDLSANNGGWQWSASTGCDAQPYFRIFNPYTQSKDYDVNGNYIKKWVHELKYCPEKYIHEPHLYINELLEIGVDIKKHYVLPIVDHKKAREEALAFYAKQKA